MLVCFTCQLLQNVSPIFRIPASLTLTTTCLSRSACRSGSPARPTPPRSAASRKHSSPSSLRSFRTTSKVCHLPVDLIYLNKDAHKQNSSSFSPLLQSFFHTCSRWCLSSWRCTPALSPLPTWRYSLTCCSRCYGSGQETSPLWCACFRLTWRREALLLPDQLLIK